MKEGDLREEEINASVEAVGGIGGVGVGGSTQEELCPEGGHVLLHPPRDGDECLQRLRGLDLHGI